MSDEVAPAILLAALRLAEKDPHQYSSRPCVTCRTISGLIDMPFGCEKKLLAPAVAKGVQWLPFRGSVSDLATGIMVMLNPDQRKALIEELTRRLSIPASAAP